MKMYFVALMLQLLLVNSMYMPRMSSAFHHMLQDINKANNITLTENNITLRFKEKAIQLILPDMADINNIAYLML